MKVARSRTKIEKRFMAQYAALSALLAVPLVWAFLRVQNFYPAAASTMMMVGGDVRRGADYYILRGETQTGEIVSVNPTHLTNALFMRTWGLAQATAHNLNFKMPAPYPANAALVEAAGGAVENLPDGARVPDLIRAWGEMYNDALPSGSPQRLKTIWLDAYRWNGGEYAAYDNYIKSWRAEL